MWLPFKKKLVTGSKFSTRHCWWLWFLTRKGLTGSYFSPRYNQPLSIRPLVHWSLPLFAKKKRKNILKGPLNAIGKSQILHAFISALSSTLFSSPKYNFRAPLVSMQDWAPHSCLFIPSFKTLWEQNHWFRFAWDKKDFQLLEKVRRCSSNRWTGFKQQNH